MDKLTASPFPSHRPKLYVRVLSHIAAIGLLWLVAQYPLWAEKSTCIAAACSVLYIAPLVGGDALDCISSRSGIIKLPYGAWWHIAFILIYSILLYPIIWQPFRHKWLNYAIPIITFITLAIMAFVIFVLSFHAK